MTAALKSLLILAALAIFAGGLVQRGLHDAASEYGPPPDWQRTPGLRVLLTDPTTGRDAHDSLSFLPLQPLAITSRHDPGLYQEVGVGVRCQVLPLGREGLILLIPALDLRQTWQVRDIDILPLSRITGSLSGSDLQLASQQLAKTEAADRQACFALLHGALRRQYRGCLHIAPANAQSLYAINHLPIEAYVEGLLQAELSGSWPEQALKAQAIAGRSLALAQAIARREQAWDITDSARDPTYRGCGTGSVIIDAAVKETHGRILTLAGDPFPAFFHASSGGHTATASSVFPDARSSLDGARLDTVMPAKEDLWCRRGVELKKLKDSHWQYQTILHNVELRDALIRADQDIWPTAIDVTFRPGSGRVDEVSLRVWNRSNKQINRDLRLSGHDFRELIGLDRLRSTLWVGEPIPVGTDAGRAGEVGWQITTFGWGHGVGLSQISAYAMADAGWQHREILAFFYPGADIVARW